MRLPLLLPDDDEPPLALPQRRPKSRVIETVTHSPGKARKTRETRQVAAPIEHWCACGEWGAYGIGPPVRSDFVWFCRAHIPADFLPASGAQP